MVSFPSFPTMPVSLTPNLLSSVIQYLNADDLAHLAQTNKAWKTYVYRSSVWNYRTWSMSPTKMQHFFDDGKIPSDARHTGVPTQQCFVLWAQHMQSCTESLPRAIVQEQDPKRYMKMLRAYWDSHNRPCIIACHHRWYDVVKGRNLIADLPVSEQERMRYRLIQYPRSETSNSYRTWLTARAEEMPILHIQTPLVTIDPAADPCTVLRLKWHNILIRRNDMIQAMMRELYDRYTSSATALSRHGKLLFDMNDRTYKARYEELLWDMTFTSGTVQEEPTESESAPLPSDTHSHE
jgi:hypothetical protein